MQRRGQLQPGHERRGQQQHQRRGGRHAQRQIRDGHVKTEEETISQIQCGVRERTELASVHFGASTQSQSVILFSLGSAGYQFGSTVAAVSTQRPVKTYQKCSTKYHDSVDVPQCNFPNVASKTHLNFMKLKYAICT